MRTTNKRITNNEENSSPSDPNDDVYYAVYDTDTEEYLTDWDTDQDSGEVEYQQWQEMNFDDEDAVLGNIRKFDTAVLTYSRKSAEKLLFDVAHNLCERFPDEQINLQVLKITVKILRSAEVQEAGQVQTFGGEVEEDELLDEEEEWVSGAHAVDGGRFGTRRYAPVEERIITPKKEKKAKKTSRKRHD
jgi:hypothetical protein